MGGWIFVRETDETIEYWTGKVDRNGKPLVSEHPSDAYHFASHAAALQTADTHRALRNSDTWKVRRR